MIRSMLTLFLPLVVLYSIIGGANPNVDEGYLQDVYSFIEKREQCDYLRGEMSGEGSIDETRDLNKQLDKYCKGSDQALIKLKLKYKYDKQVSKKLNAYEESIEPSE